MSTSPNGEDREKLDEVVDDIVAKMRLRIIETFLKFTCHTRWVSKMYQLLERSTG